MKIKKNWRFSCKKVIIHKLIFGHEDYKIIDQFKLTIENKTNYILHAIVVDIKIWDFNKTLFKEFCRILTSPPILVGEIYDTDWVRCDMILSSWANQNGLSFSARVKQFYIEEE